MIDEELIFGGQFSKCFFNNDYNGAAKICLSYTLEKIKKGDYRNAALMAKKMFDVMLDDACLIGETKDVGLLKDCSMTCNFLNAVICLYSERYQEAIGYANMVLDRKACMEAMFIKARALYALEQYEKASDMIEKMKETAKDPDDPKSIDKKQHLFEMHLIKLCPQYIPAYLMMRSDAIKDNITIEVEEDEEVEDEENVLVNAFNDKTISDSDFEKFLTDIDKTSVEFKQLFRKLRNIEIENIEH